MTREGRRQVRAMSGRLSWVKAGIARLPSRKNGRAGPLAVVGKGKVKVPNDLVLTSVVALRCEKGAGTQCEDCDGTVVPSKGDNRMRNVREWETRVTVVYDEENSLSLLLQSPSDVADTPRSYNISATSPAVIM